MAVNELRRQSIFLRAIFKKDITHSFFKYIFEQSLFSECRDAHSKAVTHPVCIRSVAVWLGVPGRGLCWKWITLHRGFRKHWMDFVANKNSPILGLSIIGKTCQSKHHQEWNQKTETKSWRHWAIIIITWVPVPISEPVKPAIRQGRVIGERWDTKARQRWQRTKSMHKCNTHTHTHTAEPIACICRHKHRGEG